MGEGARAGERTATVPPTDTPPRAERSWAPSLLLVNTGDGKGKTTAALGTLLRARARGWPVCVVQFMKSGDWKVGEEQSARALGIDSALVTCDVDNVGSRAVIERNGQLLLVHNLRRSGRTDWSTPGGVIDAGATLLPGLTREVEDETGLRGTAWDAASGVGMTMPSPR